MGVNGSLNRRLSTLERLKPDPCAQHSHDAALARHFASVPKEDLQLFVKVRRWEEFTPEEQGRIKALLAPIDRDGEMLRRVQRRAPKSLIPPGATLAEAAAIYHEQVRAGRFAARR